MRHLCLLYLDLLVRPRNPVNLVVVAISCVRLINKIICTKDLMLVYAQLVTRLTVQAHLGKIT